MPQQTASAVDTCASHEGKLRLYWHQLAHLAALAGFLARHPRWAWRAGRLAAAFILRLGWQPTIERISGKMWAIFKGPAMQGCSICQWAEIRRAEAAKNNLTANEWFRAYRPSKNLLAGFRARRWPSHAPTFTVLMPVYAAPLPWLAEAIESVLAQTYPHWQLVCVNDGSPDAQVARLLDRFAAADKRIRAIHLPSNEGVCAACNRGLLEARGDYVCLLDHDDALEPQALHRFAEAILADNPDLLYSDEVVTGPELGDVWHVEARPQFSYDFYLSHPYFVHLVGMRTELVREVGGFDESMTVSHDVDLVLRLVERARTVCHVPDILYRWRTHAGSLGHVRQRQVDRMTSGSIRRHFERLGQAATIDTLIFNSRKITFAPDADARVAIIIPTHNQGAILRACLSSLERTLLPGRADVYVVNHRSDDPDTLAYLRTLRHPYRVLPEKGPFNFSAIMNHAVARLEESYSHYLFLNNDIEALQSGWLEHMLGLGCRSDVGAVGALLLYPTKQVQHAGVIIGLNDLADHVGRLVPAFDMQGRRAPGPRGMLLAARDSSAVTGACLLIRADVFARVGGFDRKLAVGFGDTDLCLRIRQAGYKVLLDPHACLMHYESLTRGHSETDPHPQDSRLFVERYAALIRAGDPFHNPLLSRVPGREFEVRPGVAAERALTPRTVAVQLPGATDDAIVLTLPAHDERMAA